MEKTAIIPVKYLPETTFNTYAKGKITGATKGLSQGFLTAIGSPFVGAIWGAPLGEGGAVVGMLLGALYGAAKLLISPFFGAVKAVPKKQAAEIERSIPEILTKLNVQETFAEHVLQEGKLSPNTYIELITGQGPSINRLLKNAF